MDKIFSILVRNSVFFKTKLEEIFLFKESYNFCETEDDFWGFLKKFKQLFEGKFNLFSDFIISIFLINSAKKNF